MKRLIVILLVIALLTGAVLGGYLLLQGNSNSQASTASDSFQQVVTAQRGNLSSAISVVGELDPVTSADLAFNKLSSATKLATLKVTAGNAVRAGDVLATVDPATYQQAVDQAKSDLQAAEETLKDLTTPPTESEIADAELAIAQAQYQIQEAKSVLDDLQNPDLEELETNVSDAKTSLAKAQANLLNAQQSAKDSTSIDKLIYTENTLTETYNRLAAEKYSDDKYQDRLQIAYNKMMDAREARIIAEVQSQVNLLNAQISLHKAERTLAEAQQALADAKKGGDQLDLANAELNVKAGEVALAAAQADRAELDAGADATKLAAAQSDVAKKKLALARAEEALTAATLVAPFDGTILEVPVQVGDRVASGTRVLTIADLSKLQVLASVDETTVRSVTAGQKATVTFDALPGKTLAGVVGEVPLQGALQGDVMTYEVPIVLEGAERLGARVGMTADVSIATGDAENVLLVPAMALTKSNGMYQVMVADPADPAAEPQSVPVQIGLSDGTYTQITAGLNEGDQVVVEMSTSTGTSNRNLNARGLGGGNVMGMFGIR